MSVIKLLIVLFLVTVVALLVAVGVIAFRVSRIYRKAQKTAERFSTSRDGRRVITMSKDEYHVD
jgi:flagellar basal body-associated protein FliL